VCVCVCARHVHVVLRLPAKLVSVTTATNCVSLNVKMDETGRLCSTAKAS